MSLPSTEAFNNGNFFKAWVAALTKKDMKPNLTPWTFSNWSLYLLRMAITGAILTSLNVVRIALLACDSSRRSAIRARKRLIGTRSSGRLPVGIGALGKAIDFAPPATALSTSPLVIRPSRPEPAT